MEARVTVQLTNVNLGEIKTKLEEASKFIQDSASVDVSVIKGDRPWESDQYSLTISGETK